MTGKMTWTEVDLAVRPAWRRLFNADTRGFDVAGHCPICGRESLHRWYALDTDARTERRGIEYLGPGRLWEWCSSCYHYEYYPDGFVPAWWQPPFAVSVDQMEADPGPIEQARRSEI